MGTGLGPEVAHLGDGDEAPMVDTYARDAIFPETLPWVLPLRTHTCHRSARLELTQQLPEMEALETSKTRQPFGQSSLFSKWQKYLGSRCLPNNSN